MALSPICIHGWISLNYSSQLCTYKQMSQGGIRNENNMLSSISGSPSPDISEGPQDWRKQKKRAGDGEAHHPWVYCIVHLFASESIIYHTGYLASILNFYMLFSIGRPRWKNYSRGPQLHKRNWMVNENLHAWWLFISHSDVAACLNGRLDYK